MKRKMVLLVVAVVIAALGASLIFLYVRGVDSRAIADQQPVKVLTATASIGTGETAASAQEAGKLELTEMPSASVVDGALTSTDSISDSVALSTIFAGEQILEAKFGASAEAAGTGLTIPKDKLAISVQLDDPGRVAGFVTPGSQVAIYVSLDPIAAGAASGTILTRLLLPDVEVIAVGETTVLSTTKKAASGSETTAEVPQTILTIGVDQTEADKVIFSAKNGTLSVALVPEGTTVKADAGVTISDLFK